MTIKPRRMKMYTTHLLDSLAVSGNKVPSEVFEQVISYHGIPVDERAEFTAHLRKLADMSLPLSTSELRMKLYAVLTYETDGDWLGAR